MTGHRHENFKLTSKAIIVVFWLKWAEYLDVTFEIGT